MTQTFFSYDHGKVEEALSVTGSRDWLELG